LRVVTIEDALEMVVRQPNAVRLLFGAGGEGNVTPSHCLHAALRMRPDLIPVQELREPASAWVYLNEVATGHPGSPTTIHGETAPQAMRRLFALLKGSTEGASISDAVLLDMMGAAIDVIIPIGADGSARHLAEIWFADDAARRGETVADLLGQH
jgi:type IV secretion system protein VirB11